MRRECSRPVLGRLHFALGFSVFYVLFLTVFVSGTSAYGMPGAANGLESTIGLKSTNYFSSGPSMAPSLLMSLEGSAQGSALEAAFSTEGSIHLVHPESHYLTIPEAYVGTAASPAVMRLYAGRRLFTWSVSDDFFQGGIWQPRFRWDYVEPRQMGLIGLFSEVRFKNLQITGLLSPLYLPEQSGSLEFQEGRCQNASLNQWVTCPTDRIPILGLDTDVNYSLKMPALSSIVVNPGAAVKARYGERRGPFASVAYAYKPRNQILLAYDGYLQLKKAGQVDLYPRVAYQHLSTFEGGYVARKWRAWGSVTRDVPAKSLSQDPENNNLTLETPSAATLASIGGDWEFFNRGPQASVLSFGVQKRFGGITTDQGGRLGTGAESIFEGIYPFEELVQFGLATTVPYVLNYRLTFSARVFQDIATLSRLYSAHLTYRPAVQWRMGLGGDILSGQDGVTNYIARYRRNDRVVWGVSYAF